MVRPSQIEHLLVLTSRHFNKGRETLEAEIGKSLEELTRREASDILKHYQQTLSESRSSISPQEARASRKRAYLPEGVDGFELQYLTFQQNAEALLHFTLFDGRLVSGRIIGFGPYSITIQEEESGQEVTLQKLAIAYYRVAESNDVAGSSQAQERQSGEAL
jgi:hypothetical protein